MLGDPVQLVGVPEGCLARPTLVADGDGGWRLPRDRSRRVKLTTVELSSADPDQTPQPPDGADRRFLLGRQSRRWPTIVEHYGTADAAWTAAVALCGAGLITLSCRVEAARLGAPTGWAWTAASRGLADAQRNQLDAAHDSAREFLVRGGDVPGWVDVWLADVARSGALARSPDDADTLLTTAAVCLAALPADGGEAVGRHELAVRHGGTRGAHALDDGHRLTALVLRGAAARAELPYPRTAAERRAVWAAVGVTCDTVSATVLVANLRPTSDGLVARQLIERAQARLPTHLTTRDLASGPLRLSAGSEVFACENPRVLEAAVDRGVTAPLICTAGNPTTVTIGLLRQLGENARICYRGDFDWPGIAIANRVIRHTGCGTWRYDAASYCTAVAAAGGDLVPLIGRPTDAAWDSTLAAAMITAGAAVHEELMLDELVAYLAER